MLAQRVAELAHDLAAARRGPALPVVERLGRARGDPLVVGGGGVPDGRDRPAGGRIDRLDQRSGGLEPGAGEGAGVLLGEAEAGKQGRNVGRAGDSHEGSPLGFGGDSLRRGPNGFGRAPEAGVRRQPILSQPAIAGVSWRSRMGAASPADACRRLSIECGGPMPLLPALLLACFAFWSGTFPGAATFPAGPVGQALVLAAALFGAASWRDPLRLGPAGRWLVGALARGGRAQPRGLARGARRACRGPAPSGLSPAACLRRALLVDRTPARDRPRGLERRHWRDRDLGAHSAGAAEHFAHRDAARASQSARRLSGDHAAARRCPPFAGADLRALDGAGGGRGGGRRARRGPLFRRRSRARPAGARRRGALRTRPPSGLRAGPPRVWRCSFRAPRRSCGATTRRPRRGRSTCVPVGRA